MPELGFGREPRLTPVWSKQRVRSDPRLPKTITQSASEAQTIRSLKVLWVRHYRSLFARRLRDRQLHSLGSDTAPKGSTRNLARKMAEVFFGVDCLIAQ